MRRMTGDDGELFGMLGITLILIGALIAVLHLVGCVTDTGAILGAATNIVSKADGGSATPTTTDSTTTTTQPPVESNDFAGVTVLGVDVSSWPVTTALSGSVSGGRVTLRYDKASVWPAVNGVVGNAWAIVDHNGKRYAASWEWLKPGQTLKDMRGKSWSDHFKRSELTGWEPKSGDRIGLFTTGLCRDSRRNVTERSSVAWVTVN